MSGNDGSPWSVQFRRERQAAWQELDALVKRVERDGLSSLGAEKVARLYRKLIAARAALYAQEQARIDAV